MTAATEFSSPLIVVPGLEHHDVLSFDEIDETVLTVDSSRPGTLEHVAERLGLADATRGTP
jgi:hypothetical protein